MPVKISLKNALFIVFSALASAAAAAFLLNFFLSGPKLGLHYDFLLKLQKPPAASREILIIETGEYIESGRLSSVFLTLAELDAAYLFLSGRILPSASVVSIPETEIRRRFFDEYFIIENNIRSLFDGIRMGSVSPVQAPVFVDTLVDFTLQGRDRLLSDLITRDEDLYRSIAVFGNYHETEAAEFDKDGVLRRVELANPVFAVLEQRYAFTQVETVKERQILYLLSKDGTQTDIVLDKNGRLIASSYPPFRKIGVSLFSDYSLAESALRSNLIRANESGAFSNIPPEHSPLFLHDYAMMLQDEMLANFSTDNIFRNEDDFFRAAQAKDAWIAARKNYFDSLDLFFGAYNGEKEEYEKLLDLRSALEEALRGSFCVMGSGDSALYTAILANALMTADYIYPADEYLVLLLSIAAALVFIFVILMMRPVYMLLSGFLLSVLYSGVFCFFFVFYSYWIDPVMIFTVSFAGTLAAFICKCAGLRTRRRLFCAAYGCAVPEKMLKELIAQGRPKVTERVVRRAAVIAIKDSSLLSKEDKEASLEAGSYKRNFYSGVKKIAHDNGGIIAGFEGDTAIVCFGSPLDKALNPVRSAYNLVRQLLKDEKNSWRFGIDAGDCNFFWSPDTGYCVSGRPAVRARLLASRTVRSKSRALFTGNVREEIRIKRLKAGLQDA